MRNTPMSQRDIDQLNDFYDRMDAEGRHPNDWVHEGSEDEQDALRKALMD